MTDDTQTPGLIPDQLLSNLKKGDCVLFLGADLPLGYKGAPLSRPELAAALANKYDLPPGLPWPEAAQAYLGKFTGDRHGLISFVAERCSGPNIKPGPLHEAIARAGFRAIVTAWYDELLEETLKSAGYRVNRVVRDTQLPYAHEGEREVIVVKLYGCLSDSESLVLNTWDHKKLMNRLSRKLELVTSFCALRPPLFVGFDLADDTPMDLYVRASTNMAEHMQRAYAVWPHPLDAVRAVWQGQNIEFCRADAAAFLQALAAQAPPVGPIVRGAIRVRRPPYKFLDYYKPGDADIFCGRDTESQIVARLALSHRLLTLFGPSGAGKTSLLLAGVLPRLSPEGYNHVYVRALDDPLPAVRKAVAARAGRSDWKTGDDPSTDSGQALRVFLREMLSPDDKLVVVLDQFEELFLRVGSGKRAAFFHELAVALDRPEREVRFIFSLREDYLACLDEARDDLPDVFANSRRLAALDQANARVAITEPAARAGVTVEAALVDALVGGEGKEAGGQQAGDLVEADGHVPPAALQIVLDRLYREALPPGHPPDDPPPPGLRLTLDAYRAIHHRLGEGEEAEELAGAEAILAGYVGEGLARLPDLKQEDGQTPLGADPALGKEILKVMVTSQATKAALTHAEVLAGLDEAGIIQAGDKADQKAVENTRLGLEQVRLLRGFERDGVAFYELAHDHLAAEIATWISREEMQAKLARELLRREMDSWHSPLRKLIEPGALQLIHEQRQDLRRPSPDELELLFRSALAAEYEVAYWRDRADQAGLLEQVEDEWLGKLEDEATAAEATAALGGIATPRLVERLAQMVEADFAEGAVRDVLHLTTARQRRAVAALSKMTGPEASAALDRWTPQGMILIPAGPFTMGSTESGDEGPVHQVWLDAFWITRTPVTKAEYAEFIAAGGYERQEYWTEAGWVWKGGRTKPQEWDELKGKGDHPVRYLTWYEAVAYARWRGAMLPSEAQWEKAARGGLQIPNLQSPTSNLQPPTSNFQPPIPLVDNPNPERRYPWGDRFDRNKCNTAESDIGNTTSVGRYSPQGDSPYGVADMAGNVWEWTSSLYRPYPYSVEDGREDPEASGHRVLRGGSFNHNEHHARCSYRHSHVPDYEWNDYGCRVGWCAAPALPWDSGF